MTIVTKELVINQLSKNVLETQFEDLNSETVEDAKDRMIDILGCALGGAYADGNKALIDVLRGWGGNKEATILVYGNKVPLPYAAMINSVMCRSYDYEACGPLAVGEAVGRLTGHICGTTECTAISVGEVEKTSGKELIASTIVGGDLAARIAVTEEFSFDNSFELTGTVNAFGATATAGRLMGLTEPQLVNAFGILVNMIAGSFQCLFDGVHCFKLPQGESAKNAIFAVQLSRKGFTGIKDPLFSRQGYFNLYCKSYKADLLTKDLGKIFYSKGAHKFFPSCYDTHAAIECCLKILTEHNVNTDEIAEVSVGVNDTTFKGFLNQSFEMGDSPQRALFNLPYGVANVLLRKSSKMEHYTADYLRDPKVIDLAAKVKLLPTTPPETPKAIDVTVKMKGGKESSAHVDCPRGNFETALTRDELKDKYWDNFYHCRKVSRENAEKALDMLGHLDEIDDVSKIVKLLVA